MHPRRVALVAFALGAGLGLLLGAGGTLIIGAEVKDPTGAHSPAPKLTAVYGLAKVYDRLQNRTGIPLPGFEVLPALPLDEDEGGNLTAMTSAVADGLVRDVMPWFGDCTGPRSGFAAPFEVKDRVLRYVLPQQSERFSGIWYRDLEGQRVRASEIPEGKFAYATFSWGGTSDGAIPIVVLLTRLNASDMGPSWAPFAFDGVVAFNARSPYSCDPVEPVSMSPARFYGISMRAPGLGSGRFIVYEMLGVEAAWDLRGVVRDMAFLT